MIDKVEGTDTIQENIPNLTQVSLFRVMQRKQPVIIFRMEPDGTRMPALPVGKSLEETWPRYSAVASYLDTWFAQMTGCELVDFGGHIVFPGDGAYPKALALALSRSGMIKLWAYVTPAAVWVSFRQIALGFGRQPTLALRHEIESKGIQFTTDRGHYLTSIETVSGTLGVSIADRILLYPHQVAGFLGVVPKVATRMMKRFGIALGRDDVAVAPWGKLRLVRRVGPRKFEVEAEQTQGS